MTAAFAESAPLASALAEAWFAALWQGLVLAGTVAVSLRLLPGLSAGRRSLIWVAVLLLLAGTHFSCQNYAVPHGVLLRKAGQQTAWMLDVRWSLALAAAWCFASALQAARVTRGLVQARAIGRRATPLASSQDLPEGSSVYESSTITRPCVVGFRRPRIVLPRGLAQQLSPAEMRQVLLHESEHLRRGDHWLNLLQKLLLVLFPLNPAMILVERRLCAERELACDDRVMQVTGARKAYAACLARVAEHRLSGRCAALAVGAWDRRPELVRRVERILHTAPHELHGWRARTVSGFVLAGAFSGAALLIQTPTLVGFTVAQTETSSVLQPRQRAQSIAWPVAALPAYASAENVTHRVSAQAIAYTQRTSKRVRLRHAKRLPQARIESRLLIASNQDHDFSPMRPMQVSWPADLTPGDTKLNVRQRPAAMLPTLMYVVRTPEGWLILQL